jgi:hypothetical protein
MKFANVKSQELLLGIRNGKKFTALHNTIFFIKKKYEFHVIYDKFITFVKIFYQTDFNLKVLLKLKKIINTK